MNQISTSKNSTNVRFAIPPSFWVAPLRVAPWLQKPVLTRLFLRPTKRAPARGDRLGQLVGTVRIGSEAVKVRARGRGPSVLLVHGWEGSGAHLERLGDRLVAAGFAVVTCDMPAHGETGGTTTSLPEFARTVEEVDRLVGPFHGIVAHSLGATAVSLAVSRGLEAQALVLVAPMPSFDFALDEFAKVLHLDPEMREATAVGTESRVGITRPEVDLFSFTRPRARVALAHDTDDRRVPYHYSSQLQERWDLPEVFTTKGLGHRRILEDEGLGRFVEEQLGRVSAPSTSPLSFELAPELSF